MSATLICAAAGCDNPVQRRPGQGRPPIYCTPTCRTSAKGNPPISVHLDHDNDDDTGPARTWNVTLQRGTRTVVVAQNLGRFTATALTGELRAILNPRTRQDGDAID